jgi:hypothetical protein
MKRLAGLILLIISLFFTSTFAQEHKLYRINDLVGDTIDISEREQYNLFPGIANFQSVIFFKADTFYLSQINYLQNDTWKTDTLQLTAFDINRINHCINNADTIIAMVNRDAATKAAYDRFWQEIESKQFNAKKLKEVILKSREGRTYGSITGMTLGSGIGGIVGSQVGIEYIGTRYESCYPGSIRIPMYQVNQPIFCCINALSIGTGTYIGYQLGEQKDRKYSPAMTEIKEGKGWRIGCGITSGIIGTYLGSVLIGFSVSSLFGKTSSILTREVEGEEVVVVPALLMGIGIAYNITYWGVQLGKQIDHNRAVKKAKKKPN